MAHIIIDGLHTALFIGFQGTELGLVKSARAGTVDVDTGSAFVRVKQNEVIGKLVAVVPFLGIPLGWVGL